MTDLVGHVALVTGGSRGIGAATARLFAAAGARVIITHRDSAADAEAVRASMPGEGHRVIKASAADTSAIEAAAESVRETEGRLDVLVNNAARTKVIAHGDMEALTDDLFDAILQTNVRGTFATIRAFRGLLADGDGGLVVNISSLAARTAGGSNVAYCASKAAMDNMTVALARALAPKIRVLSVAPGLVETQFTSQWDPKVKKRYLERTALGKLPTPEDVGRAVVAAMTHLTLTTGAIIPVDGGRPLG
ncbi:MAG: SDR family oxidoreductase [Gemmatimonadota bacterium]|nr:SDR family oxidoreductase [Gemmatimonadota bacterium]MDH3421597.1 SDR family oxidoreductase [Gemmatimonadota bacterium]